MAPDIVRQGCFGGKYHEKNFPSERGNFFEIPLDKFRILCYNNFCDEFEYAAVVELADTRDLKSLGVKSVPVQVRSAALKIP